MTFRSDHEKTKVLGTCMEEIYETLASRAVNMYNYNSEQRTIIAIAGVPGSGKTTLAGHVANRINSKYTDVNAIVVPMDGFHYSRAQLDQMEDPKLAHERRGAPFTFDAQGLVNLVKELSCNSTVSVFAPTFDHKVKDPVENGLEIKQQNRIVLLEGLYLLLKEKPWCEIAGLVDEKWLITVEPERARVRVGKRHVEAGITPTLELGLLRADTNDADNGKLVISQSFTPDVVVQSVEEVMYEIYSDSSSSSESPKK